jgi:hypothetical protein
MQIDGKYIENVFLNIVLEKEKEKTFEKTQI